MFTNNYQATLLSDNDVLLEYGFASISLKNKSVDFTNTFVPLIKIGATVKIICSKNGQDILSFTGEVYLSSKKLLRIISVKCTLLPDAEKLLDIDTKINAEVLLDSPKTKAFAIQSPRKPVDCIITSISTQKLTFHSSQLEFDWASPLTIKIHEPIFNKPSAIKILANKNSLVFGDKARYDCQITMINDTAILELMNFIRVNIQDVLKDILDSSNHETNQDESEE
ncbi:MAG: hypothetical protein GX286_03170 [Clostridiales bacterium]|jgi:hypothetical protein|nr:hypothetical protein [Clostridiales bacterium]